MKILGVGDINGERGIGKITLLVFGTIISVIVFCAYEIVPFFYYYYELLNQFESHIRVASTYTNQEIREKLWYHIRKMGIPVQKEALKIRREGGEMRIRLKYKEVFYITYKGKDYLIWEFPFDADVRGRY